VNVKYDGPPQERTCLGCGAPVVWDRGDLAWRVLAPTDQNNAGLICVAGLDDEGADDQGHFVVAEKVFEIVAVAEVVYEDARRAGIAEISSAHIAPFTQIREWVDTPDEYELVPNLDGKRVRVTVEVLR
jgi:hypothetical protein